MADFPTPDLGAAAKNPTDRTKDPKTGYVFDTTSQVWKDACAHLPSCMAVQWPGYATAAFPARVCGVDAIIQPWMGHCQQLFGRTDFPGGIGGEVGVYVKAPKGKPLPNLSLLPLPAQLLLKAAAAFGDDHLWWPDPDVQPAIDFTILNPANHSVLLRAQEQKNYWVNKWMEPNSYEQYKKDQGGHVPFWATGYKMVFTVDGVTRAWSPS